MILLKGMRGFKGKRELCLLLAWLLPFMATGCSQVTPQIPEISATVSSGSIVAEPGIPGSSVTASPGSIETESGIPGTSNAEANSISSDSVAGLNDDVSSTTENSSASLPEDGSYNKLKPFHPKMKKWLGYIVKMDDIRYYVAGDTDVNEDIRKVQRDVALIPIGGYYTMDRKQAAEYVAALKPVTVIPTHYGSIIGSKTNGREFTDALKSMASDIQVELKLH